VSKSLILWAVFCAALAFYSLLVWDAGYKLLPQNYDQAEAQMVDEIEAKGNLGVPYAEVADEAMKAYPLWNNLTAMVTGTYYGFGNNGNSDPVRYYNSMEPIEKSVLSLHMVLGGALLILGMFQFTSMFRKRYRKAHRAIAGVYILGCFTMTFAAIYHLLHTGVENTYQGFAFHIQLWFLASSTIICQALAIYFIKKRNFALHLGFQVYTFSAFLNAPIQRYDWVIFGKMYPHLTQGEVNNLVNILTFWQCLLVGYLLFAWNRAAAPIRPKPIEIVPQPPGLKVFLSLVAAAAVLTSLAMYVASPGLGSWTVAQAITPASTLAADAALYAGKSLQTAAFGIAISAAILSGIWLMIRDESSRVARNIFYISAVTAGLQQMAWGYQLGEPMMAVTSGGGFYIVSGLSLSVFTLVALYYQVRGREHMWHETMIFAVNFAFAPALLLWGHGLWYLMDVIPDFYLDRGHGYVLAAGAAILTPTFNGFIGMMTSRETQSRAIS
jgi:hypothetical protein